jgi:translation initiation factor IF-2
MPTRPTRPSGSSNKPGEPSAAPRKSAIKRITAPSRAAAKPAPAPVPPPEPPKPPRETLSLIDPVEKRKPSPDAAARKAGSMLPPISRVRVEPPPAAAAPVASPEPPPAPEVEPGDGEAGAEGAEKILHFKPPIPVKELARLLGVKPFQLIHDLMEMEIFASINHMLDRDEVRKLCEKHGFKFEPEKRDKEKKSGPTPAPAPVIVEVPKPEEPQEIPARAPIVTFMGHVDHGKTSLLDAIRKSRVAAGEAGGITQHIGAYRVEVGGSPITFLDTPGHAAFTAMRARGANVTDIVVLVVASDDGLMPQTLEAISHARAAKGVEIIVAINKIDLPAANPDRVKAQLQEQGLAPEDWGGSTICVPVSATKGTGIPQLLEMIQLQAEMQQLRAPDRGPAKATVIEAQMEPGRGPTATVIVREGTLKVGSIFLCGNHWGKVKALIDDQGRQVKQASPATPVKVLGFTGLPGAGDELEGKATEREARSVSEERLVALRSEKLAAPQRATLESIFSQTAEDQPKVLRVVLKADVQGSLEALVQALDQIDSKKANLELLHAAVGPISESDVLLASASNAVIIGFGVKVDTSASAAAKRAGIQIKLYSIIYELIDQVKEAMAGLLDPISRETVVGHAEVKQVFDLSRGRVAGCMVTDGRIARTGRARLLRDDQPIYDGGIATLKRFQDDVKEVRVGLECGIKLGDFSDYEAGDVIECYTLEKVTQTL